MTILELPIFLTEKIQINFPGDNKLAEFLDECKELSLLNKIKFDEIFSYHLIKEFHSTIIKPDLFPNLRSIEFKNVTFTFKDKKELI